ncbi:UNVERIFIED_CONTAM: hypothetical protein Sindi_1272100 [Sesamum indicum]
MQRPSQARRPRKKLGRPRVLGSTQEASTLQGSALRGRPNKLSPRKEIQCEDLLHLSKASREGMCPQGIGLFSLRGLSTRKESSPRRNPSSPEDLLLNERIRCNLIHQNRAFLARHVAPPRTPTIGVLLLYKIGDAALNRQPLPH